STRIRTTQQHYHIPLLYERGWIVYRIRAIGKLPDDSYEEEVYGPWSSEGMTYSTLADWISEHSSTAPTGRGRLNFSGHETDFNWQSSISFAEDGKRKDVISYFDGSLRNRQSVTQISSTGTIIVGETVYDSQGRPAVNILPVPSDATDIHYHSGFNLNTSLDPYNRQNFDLDAGDCEAGTGPLDPSSGAGKYYSPTTTLVGNYQDYRPDAEGYPYTYTQYTPDN